MPQPDRIRTPWGTLTRRGELLLATLAVLAFLLVLGLVGGVELGTL
jgi:hypothetical protein